MKRGMLSDLFTGVVAKRLTVVETDPKRSNQHEFQGIRQIRDLLGDEDRKRIPTRFIWMSGDRDTITEDGFISWSNVRKGKPRAPEYHLYYSGNAVTERMQAGNMLFFALRPDGSALVIITSSDTFENQLLWLFSLGDLAENVLSLPDLRNRNDTELTFAARYILEEMGIDTEDPDADELDSLLDRFGLEFPTTRTFSELARASLRDLSPLDDPDRALLDWMEREELLFRRLEKRIVAARIENGFHSADGADVEGFLAFSLSVQNRRKARAGQALENHLQAVFASQNLRFKRGAETENRNKPDFLFPGPNEYRNPLYPSECLTMLGAKSTLKDRWRQVLSEAERIPEKHLLTLEPGISENQTNEMRAKKLQLVVPYALHATYKPAQQNWLITLADFIRLVRSRDNQP